MQEDSETAKNAEMSQMQLTTTFIGALCWSILVSGAHADDWPQWQGPQRDVISKETGLLKGLKNYLKGTK